MSTHQKLVDFLLTIDTRTMTSAEVLEACQRAVPKASIREVAAALEASADLQRREAHELEILAVLKERNRH
jgi:hypothetical protein